MRTLLISLIVALAAAPAAAQLPAPGSTYHLLFATSEQMRTTTSQAIPPAPLRFGSIAGGDYLVTVAAFNAGLPSTLGWDGVSAIYHAILSVSGDNAATRLSIGGPIYNMSSQLVATGKADLFDGTLAAAVQYDEFGAAITANPLVWTGSNSLAVWSGSSCQAWNSTSAGSIGSLGNPASTAANWMVSGSNRGCNQTARLYGLSPALVAPLWGDYDGSGAVDGGDYLQWQRQLGQQPSATFAAAKAFTATSGAFNGLYEVNAADLAVWQTYLGQSLPASPVPEPQAWALVLFAIAGGWMRFPLAAGR